MSIDTVNKLLQRQKLVEDLVHNQPMHRQSVVETLVHRQHLAELEKLCGKGCEEYKDLAKAIANYNKAR